MLSYCLKCRKNTENKNIKVVKTKNGRIMLLSIMLLDVQCVINALWGSRIYVKTD